MMTKRQVLLIKNLNRHSGRSLFLTSHRIGICQQKTLTKKEATSSAIFVRQMVTS